MSRQSTDNRLEHRGARRAIAGLALAAGVAFGVVGVVDSPAGAATRTKSSLIAGEAAQAVAALEEWGQTQNPSGYVRFVQLRDQTATMTEHDMALADGDLRSAWSVVSIAKQHAILSAVSQLGVPYDNRASEPGVGFDCSGLTIWAFGSAGVEIARSSRDQINDAEPIEQTDAQAGDLVYYPGHVSIYLGADTMVHSPNSGSHVEIGPLPSRSIRFGDAAPAVDRAVAAIVDSLVDRPLPVSQ
jgi:cell wall-associated NlpC family hydrolase